jgi:hypothetical protein
MVEWLGDDQLKTIKKRAQVTKLRHYTGISLEGMKNTLPNFS